MNSYVSEINTTLDGVLEENKQLKSRILDIQAKVLLGLKAYEHIRFIFYDNPVEVRNRVLELREKFGIPDNV